MIARAAAIGTRPR